MREFDEGLRLAVAFRFRRRRGSGVGLQRRMTVVEAYEPTGNLKPVTDGVWIVDGPVIGFGYLGMKFPFPTRMTVVRVADGGLWLHSPTELSPSLESEVDALGRVRYLVAPNRIHYWWVGKWLAAYPDAMTYAAPGVQQQARSNGRCADHDADLAVDGEYPWSGELSPHFPSIVDIQCGEKAILL